MYMYISISMCIHAHPCKWMALRKQAEIILVAVSLYYITLRLASQHRSIRRVYWLESTDRQSKAPESSVGICFARAFKDLSAGRNLGSVCTHWKTESLSFFHSCQNKCTGQRGLY